MIKKILCLFLLSVLTAGTRADEQELICYFSLSSENLATVDALSAATAPDFNTQTVAEFMASHTHSALYRITSEKVYPQLMNEAMGAYQQMLMHQDKLPELTGESIFLGNYRRIYLGYPVWLNSMPLEIKAFLKQHEKELEGKEVAIFSTTGQMSNQHSINELAGEFKSLKIVGSICLKRQDKEQFKSQITAWIDKLTDTSERR